jgi:disulfide oxidoreductase YuzD
MQLMHTNILQLWKNMTCAKGYLEWHNANVGCCVVKYQFEFIVIAMTGKPYDEHFKNCKDELDRLFVMYEKMWPLFILCENELILKNVLKEQHQLYTNLVRLQYIVF